MLTTRSTLNPSGVKFSAVTTTEEKCYGTTEGGRTLNNENWQVVSVRTQGRVERADVYATQVTRTALDMANELDCSVTPRQPVCDFGFDPRDSGDGN